MHLVDGILENSELMRVYTSLNREIIKRPKVLKEDEEPPEMTEEEEKELQMKETDLFMRTSESRLIIEPALNMYNNVTYPKLQEFINYLTHSQYIKIRNSIG